MGDITLRAFELKDFKQVIELLQDVSVFRPSLDMVEELTRSFAHHTYCYSCVAIQDDRLVAFGSVFFFRRVRGGMSGVIEDMVVDSGVRRQGVGRRVLEKLLEEARARGCLKVSLEASAMAVPFYQSVGFKAAGPVMKCLL